MSNPRPIRVLVVDDHAIVRSGLVAILRRTPGIEVAGEAADGERGIEIYTRLRPDVTLMDLGLPGVDGWQTIARIRELDPHARIIAISAFGGDRDVDRALKAGARGYLLKDTEEADLIAAIRDVHQGLRSVTGDVSQILAAGAGREPLSEREVQVLKLIAEGKSNKEIAAEQGVVESTIKGHVNRILDKLGVDDRTAAATLAIARGIIRLPPIR